MKKNVNIKNYLILFGVILFTIIVTLYLFSWLKQYKDAKYKDAVIKETLAEVKYNDLDSFLKERNFSVLYMCTTAEKKCRNFEEKLKKFVVEYDLTDDIIYFNLGDNKVDKNILNNIYQKYKHESLIKKFSDYPTLLIFSEGKIIDLISSNKGNDFSINIVKNFLEGYDLIND